MADTPPPPAVDYSGRRLTEGAIVAFLTDEAGTLREGRIRLIGSNDLCIDTGEHLVTVPAAQRPMLPALRPLAGAAKVRPIPSDAKQYPQVALQPADA